MGDGLSRNPPDRDSVLETRARLVKDPVALEKAFDEDEYGDVHCVGAMPRGLRIALERDDFMCNSSSVSSNAAAGPTVLDGRGVHHEVHQSAVQRQRQCGRYPGVTSGLLAAVGPVVIAPISSASHQCAVVQNSLDFARFDDSMSYGLKGRGAEKCESARPTSAR